MPTTRKDGAAEVGPTAPDKAQSRDQHEVSRGSSASVLRLQRQVGNRAVQRLLQARPTVQRDDDLTQAAEPFDLGGVRISSYASAAAATRLWSILLDQEVSDLRRDGLAAPASLATVSREGGELVRLWEGGGDEPFDRGNAEDLRAWHRRYVSAMNDSRAAQARESASRAQAAADRAQAAADQLEALEPALRDAQRARFRSGDEGGLLQVTDAIATVLDTSLAAKDAATNTLEVAADLRQLAGTGRTSRVIITVTERVPAVLDALDKINRAYASFQLTRAALNLVTGTTTESQQGHRAVEAMSTAVSAGGTLLGASAGFTLYANLYIGPMVSACLSALARLEDMISKSTNRQWIALGRFDMVNWSLEPGGRSVFDFMLRVMRADGSDGVPAVPATVRSYFVDNRSRFDAGSGDRREMPTTGFWFWRDVDDDRIKSWVFRNRQNLWGMLYGDCPVPTGRQL